MLRHFQTSAAAIEISGDDVDEMDAEPEVGDSSLLEMAFMSMISNITNDCVDPADQTTIATCIRLLWHLECAGELS